MTCTCVLFSKCHWYSIRIAIRRVGVIPSMPTRRQRRVNPQHTGAGGNARSPCSVVFGAPSRWRKRTKLFMTYTRFSQGGRDVAVEKSIHLPAGLCPLGNMRTQTPHYQAHVELNPVLGPSHASSQPLPFAKWGQFLSPCYTYLTRRLILILLLCFSLRITEGEKIWSP